MVRKPLYNRQPRDPLLLAFVRTLGAVSVIGFVYCSMVLLHGTSEGMLLNAAIYALWFGVAYLCTDSMLRGDVWGAYILVTATLGVTIYDIVSGLATVGGACLGGLVLMIVYSYLKSR
jgi:hypothetical protein